MKARKDLLSFKPIVDVNKEGDRVWQFFPNDAIGYDLIQTANFHAGPAANLSLQSRFHSPDIDFRLGRPTLPSKEEFSRSIIPSKFPDAC